MWKKHNLEVFVSLTNLCNANCPQCNRTDKSTVSAYKELPLISWNLEKFKLAFPQETLKYCKLLKLCGTWGDPIANKDIAHIVKYIIDNSESDIVINTNGSLKTSEWWWNLGVIGGKRLTAIFDVDGITQEMHSKYRRNTDLKKILDNMKTISMTMVNIKTQTIVFKHNQEFLDDIKQLTKDNGSTGHSHEISVRFEYKDGVAQKDYYGKDGEYYEKAELTKTQKNNQTSFKAGQEVSCSWARDNIIAVNPDGQVFPCCYIATRHYENKIGLHKITDPGHSTISKYIEEDHNIFKRSLIDMIDNSKYLNNTLPNDIKNNPYQACTKHCSSVGGTETVRLAIK
jgi:MoaA/NifB/PqqE/SkfB family radical SAM enzyme